jgi:hypothetical protein
MEIVYDDIKIENEKIKYAKNIVYVGADGSKSMTKACVVISSSDVMDIIKDIEEINMVCFKFSFENDAETGKMCLVIRLEDQLGNDYICSAIDHIFIDAREPMALNYGSGVYPVLSNMSGYVTLNFVGDFMFIYNNNETFESMTGITPIIEETDEDLDTLGSNIDINKLESEFEEEGDADDEEDESMGKEVRELPGDDEDDDEEKPPAKESKKESSTKESKKKASSKNDDKDDDDAVDDDDDDDDSSDDDDTSD